MRIEFDVIAFLSFQIASGARFIESEIFSSDRENIEIHYIKPRMFSQLQLNFSLSMNRARPIRLRRHFRAHPSDPFHALIIPIKKDGRESFCAATSAFPSLRLAIFACHLEFALFQDLIITRRRSYHPELARHLRGYAAAVEKKGASVFGGW